MTIAKAGIVALVAMALVFVAGFALRSLISPPAPTTITAGSAPPESVSAAPRATLYFSAHLDEARRVKTGCRDGLLRGDECANAERAVTEAEGHNRFKKFMGH